MDFTITEEEKGILLADARESIAARLEGRPPLYRPSGKDAAGQNRAPSVLSMPCGAFVTLHTSGAEQNGRDRRLRGCIGRMTAREGLEKTVRAMAAEAAFGDPRFPPLTKEEFLRCDIEISVLSPMVPCADPRSVRVGVHGLYLTCRGRTGVLLPQVPVEQGWNLEEYLDYICIKAGVPSKSYEDPEAELFTFTAAVFGENPEES
ncbi:MAG: AmmeMemoRadiSam system protein A [Treponema sp.]|jgi:AmmeMemoRadiSam system protein A|nr:AmmeMemoRadiSam system protein A [Treponema sp.]